MSLLAPGSFVPASSVPGTPAGFCRFCHGNINALSWLHWPTTYVICGRCLSNPYEDGGEAGRLAASKLATIDQQERVLEREVMIW